MPIILEMPSLSPSMEKGNLIAWVKKEGDTISIGDVIAEIETDKAVMEMESVCEGILEKILVAEKSHDVLVQTPIAIIRQPNDTNKEVEDAIEATSQKAKKSKEKPQTENFEKTETQETEAVDEVVSQDVGKINASPLARRMAVAYGINLQNIKKGSGPHNRIVKADILKNLKQAQITENHTDETPSSMRCAIAKKLVQAKQEIPHFYITTSIEVDEMLSIREKINQSKIFEHKILIDAFIAKAVANAMLDVQDINVAWINGKIRRYATIDIAIAVAVDGGLLTPVISNADKKSIATISQEISYLSQKAKTGKISSQECSGGSITLSNLGMFDVDSFYSIVQPNQGSILSIGSAQKKPCIENDEIAIKTLVNLGYAADHRCIDGAIGAKFLDSIKRYIK